MREPKASVIINTFNRPYMMKQAIWSVLCQTTDDWELIIADDHPASERSETLRIAQQFELQDERIKVISTDLRNGDHSLNRFAHNINLAFRETTGQYISYLCDDDLFVPWRLSIFSHILDANPSYQVVYGEQMVWDIPKQEFTEQRPAQQILPKHPEGKSPFCRVNHNSIMHRRECFDLVQGWEENAPARLGDAWFFARLNKRWSFYPIPCVGEVMRMGEQNCWSGKPGSEAEKIHVGALA